MKRFIIAYHRRATVPLSTSAQFKEERPVTITLTSTGAVSAWELERPDAGGVISAIALQRRA
jgi:hypothetical protein